MGVRIEGLTRLRRKLGALTEAEARAARSEVKRGLLNIVNAAKRNVTVDRGELRNSIHHETTPDGLSGQAGTNKEHAAPTEFGSRGHWAPIAPLKAWAKRHGMDESAAYAIQQKIAREGTPAQPFLLPAFEEERPRFVQRLARALDEAHGEVAK